MTHQPMFPPPAKPQDALFYPTDISPDDLFRALGDHGRLTRAGLEQIIETLISILDEADGDPDSESSLGAPERDPWVPLFEFCDEGYRVCPGDGSQEAWADGIGDELEGDDDDAESSLGAPEDHHHQQCWARGDSGDDRELAAEPRREFAKARRRPRGAR